MQKRNFTSSILKVQTDLQIVEEYEQWLNEFVGNSRDEKLNKVNHTSRTTVNNPYYQPIQGA